MKNIFKIRFISYVFVIVLLIISSSTSILLRVSFVLDTLRYSNVVVQDVNCSLFSLIITTSKDTYKITNTTAIIAISSFVLLIGQVVYNKSKQKNGGL